LVFIPNCYLQEKVRSNMCVWLCRWAIVKDKNVADKMAMFVRHNTLGVSHEAQARATTLLRTIMSSYRNSPVKIEKGREPFFHFGQAVLENRWRRLRQALQNSSRFDLPNYEAAFCSFLQREFKPNPGSIFSFCDFRLWSLGLRFLVNITKS
jgi:L-tryptophan--pyruvate aminotransferase